ncbi:ATP-binding protein [Deferribacter autotrophicus]|uniref:ATP-binding protein n=1 Tax=Deferribacter autotrophicus TaxID=500465 RepID=A0A5A8F5G5_9BACT|nr:ATP-binding protein [Deferribacter autotrophicus]
MIKRTLTQKLMKALDLSPVVLLVGARQVGKTTLVRNLDRNYIVFDDVLQLNAAINDPIGYINSIKKPVTLDEIQKASFLLSSIKLFVDKHGVFGDFLLTGSANVLNLKNNQETLAGRMVELTLFPFSAKEKNRKPDENPILQLFDSNITEIEVNGTTDLLYKFILEGGYPLSFFKDSAEDRFIWFNSYISTYIERDIRTIGELRDLDNFIRFYNVLFPRSATLLNKSEIAKLTSLNMETVENYISLLEKVYQIALLRPYFANVSKRFVKTPKIYVTDSGIFCHIIGIRTKEDLLKSDYKGAVFETFVFSEIIKHISYSDRIIDLWFYRTHDKKEIDFILESYGQKIAIEVKAAQTVYTEDFKHIVDFQKHIDPGTIGIVLYIGDSVVPFGKNLYAVPINIFL